MTGILAMVFMPGSAAAQSWFQGKLVSVRRTRGITEAVGVYLVGNAVVLAAGLVWGKMTGLYVGLVAVATGTVLQIGWLWFRSRRVEIPLNGPGPAQGLPSAPPADSGRE